MAEEDQKPLSWARGVIAAAFQLEDVEAICDGQLVAGRDALRDCHLIALLRRRAEQQSLAAMAVTPTQQDERCDLRCPPACPGPQTRGGSGLRVGNPRKKALTALLLLLLLLC